MRGEQLVLFALLFLSSAIELSVTREVTDCYANDLDPYLLFGTKTSYEFVYEKPKLENFHVPNCEPIQIWLLSRHGTRYPGRGAIRSMQSLQDLKIQILRNHEERKNGRLCQPDLENLRTWTLNVSMADSTLLTPQGKKELQYVAKRIKSKFPSLFHQGYNQNLFEFRHLTCERTRQSAQAFADGLFGSNAGVWIPPGLENDTIIQPYVNCTSWLKHVENNSETTREMDLFLRGPEMMVLVHNVSQRLGFLYDLPQETILTIYDMCRFNKAWAVNDRSPWCAAFSREELKVLEYVSDLESYYISSYGNELSGRIGCIPLKDMLQRFEQLEDDTMQRGYQPAGVFYFTHSKMVIMMLSRMGLFSRGPPPRHYDYHEQQMREWRISKISPFTANFAAVFFKCSTGEYNRIMFFVNEKRIDLDGCNDGLCSWSYIRNRFHDVLQHCNLDWCHNDSSRISTLPISLLLVFFAYIIQDCIL